MATRDIIVIGASAGGVSALSTLVASLPPDLPAAVFIVLHVSADARSYLPNILARDAKLPVVHAPHERNSSVIRQLLPGKGEDDIGEPVIPTASERPRTQR